MGVHLPLDDEHFIGVIPGHQTQGAKIRHKGLDTRSLVESSISAIVTCDLRQE